MASQQVSAEEGNTSPPPRVNPRSRTWCFTVNNYDQKMIDGIISTTQRSNIKSYIWGREVGEQGTPHLQGFFRFKNQVTFNALKNLLPRGAHIEKAKGSDRDNYNYCSKEGDFTTNMEKTYTEEEIKAMVLKSYDGVIWKPWQQDVLDLIGSGDGDTRTIYWIYEPEGKVGKSYLAKYLACTRSVVLCSGKKADIFNQCAGVLESGRLPSLVVCDVARIGAQFVSYESIEKLKDGCFYSGKYEGRQCIFPSPIVICFANVMPLLSTMSADRWMIYIIKDNILYEKLLPKNQYN